MKKLVVLAVFGIAANALAADVLMECQAKAIDSRGRVAFEIQSTIYDLRVQSQGTRIEEGTGKKAKLVELKVTSSDSFRDDYKISILAKNGKKVIADMESPDLSLQYGVKSVTLGNKAGDYDMRLVCDRVN